LAQKVCSKCKIEKPLEEFTKNKHLKNGVISRCKECSNKYLRELNAKNPERARNAVKKWQADNKDWVKNNHKKWRDNNKEKLKGYFKKGLARDPDSFENTRLKYEYGITLEQRNQMLIDQRGFCAICGEKPDKGKKLCVDHNHETGKTRGLLCRTCNAAIGFFNESKEVVIKAVKYLEKYGE